MTSTQITQILDHPLYRECLQKLIISEQNRLYCKHDLSHFLDVARLAYIYILEHNLPYERELIYAAALLHDIGRAYDNSAHDKLSAEIATKILPECGFSTTDISTITAGILHHRHNDSTHELGNILYIADKKSRNCFACPAHDSCNWSIEKRNATIWR